MMRGLIFASFVASISALVCPAPIIPVHPETGDELYRVLLCDLNNAEDMAAQASVIVTGQGTGGCTKLEDFDIFTQLLITITADNNWLDKLAAGSSPTGDECIAVNLRIDFDLKNIIIRVNTPIESPTCPPDSGSARSQYILQLLGRALDALRQAPVGPAPPEKWQEYVQDLLAGIEAVQRVISTSSNDTSKCVATTRTLANSLVGIRSSCAGPSTTVAYSG